MKKLSNILLIASLLFIAVLFYLVTSKAPMIGIDNYIAEFEIEKSSISLFSLIDRAFFRAREWNARVGEFLYFMLAPLPHTVHDILNTCVFIIFIILILKYTFDFDDLKGKARKDYWWLCLVITSLILLYDPSLWDDFFWMADSCNHLWGLCILLATFLPFRKFYFKSYEMKKYKLVPYCLACIIAGTVSENIVPFIIGLVALIMIYKYYKEKKVYKWTACALLSLLIGYAWLVFAPSTSTRIDEFSLMDWVEESKDGFFYKFFSNFGPYFKIIGILFLIYIVKQLILTKIYKKEFKIDKPLIYISIFFILSFVSVFILLLSPYYVPRALLIITFTSLMMIAYLMHKIVNVENYIVSVIIKVVIAAIAAVIVYCNSIYLRSVYTDYLEFDKIRDTYIKNQIQILDETKVLKVPVYDKNLSERVLGHWDNQLVLNDIVKQKYNIKDGVEIVLSYDQKIR